MPYDIRTIHEDTSLVRLHYSILMSNQRLSKSKIRMLSDIYRDDYQIFAGGVSGYTRLKYYGEHLAYIAIWVIPLALVIPCLLSSVKRRQIKLGKTRRQV